MEEIDFNSLDELYQRLLPALNIKVKELKRNNISGITAQDIWNYFRKNKWSTMEYLMLNDMVDDILNVPNNLLIEYKINSKEDDQNV